MNNQYPDPIHHDVMGFDVHVDNALGHLWIEHNGSITWDQLQAIKSEIWGKDARAIEVYPADNHQITNTSIRHLWRLGAADFSPDLLGRLAPDGEDTLQNRFVATWARCEGRK